MPYKNLDARKAYLLKNKERIAAYQKEYHKKWGKRNPDKMKIKYKKRYWQTKEISLKRVKEWRIKRRQLLLSIIMKAHSQIGCHFKIHPYMPEELKKRKCWGMLTLEHPNGHSQTAKYRKFHDPSLPSRIIKQIEQGEIEPKSLMVLCTLHQIWNMDDKRQRSVENVLQLSSAS